MVPLALRGREMTLPLLLCTAAAEESGCCCCFACTVRSCFAARTRKQRVQSCCRRFLPPFVARIRACSATFLRILWLRHPRDPGGERSEYVIASREQTRTKSELRTNATRFNSLNVKSSTRSLFSSRQSSNAELLLTLPTSEPSCSEAAGGAEVDRSIKRPSELRGSEGGG